VDDLNNPSLDELDALLANPPAWASLDPGLLRHLLFYQCLSYGVSPEDDVIPRLMALARTAVARLDPAIRRQVVVQLARAIERLHREHAIRDGAGYTNALLPLLLEDRDPSVVSAAACELAILLPNDEDDPLSGPHYVHSLIDQLTAGDAKAGVLAGLLQLGDERVAPLVSHGWEHLDEDGRQTLALLIQAFRGLHTLAVEFLLSWLEHEAATPDTPSFGVVAATVARAGLHAAEHGIAEVERSFPVIDAPAGEPFRILRQWTLEAFRPQVAPRLRRLASGAAPPPMTVSVLRCWGLAEGHRDA
jgi:hypothetical protein